MRIIKHTSQIRAIKSGERLFTITDGLITSPRAGFEINQQCPRQYSQIISTCIDRGWLKPVAYMSEREMLFSGLNQSK